MEKDNPTYFTPTTNKLPLYACGLALLAASKGDFFLTSRFEYLEMGRVP